MQGIIIELLLFCFIVWLSIIVPVPVVDHDDSVLVVHHSDRGRDNQDHDDQ